MMAISKILVRAVHLPGTHHRPTACDKTRLTTEDSAQAAARFRLLRELSWPAFHNLEREKAKESEARKRNVDPEILRDLCD